MPFSLLSLASELVVEILQNLDYLSLIRCQETCIPLYRLIKRDVKLQYILELDICRLQENSISGPYSERLAYLRKYRRKWECLDFSTAVSAPTDPSSIAYDFAGGSYVQLMRGGDVVTNRIPSASNPSFTTHHQNILRDANVEYDSSENVERSPKDLAVDPTQDLIVWYERKGHTNSTLQLIFYFQSLQNLGLVHPAANRSTWIPDIDEQTFTQHANVTNWMDAELHIFQDLLAIYVSLDTWPQDQRNPGVIMIWNWKLGKVVFDSSIHPLAKQPSKSALVGRDVLLVSSLEGAGSIALYGFDPTSSSGTSRLLALFHFPPLVIWNTLYSARVQSPLPRESVTSAFQPIFDESILAITLIYATPSMNNENSYTLFVHLKTLLNLSTHSEGRHVPWDEWGRNTRLLQRVTPGVWARFVHGQMVAGARKHICRSLTVFDFSPHSRRMSKEDASSTVSESDLNDYLNDEGDQQKPGSLISGYMGRNQPTVYSERNGFAIEVTTNLPFRFVIRKPHESLSARWFMMDGERLVASVTQNGFTQEALLTFI